MSQHLLTLTDAQLAIVDQALTDLETQLSRPATLDGHQQSDDNQTAPSALQQRADTRSGLAKLAPLRMRLQRLQRLVQYAHDTEIILVNESLNCTLKGYALLNEPPRHSDPGALSGKPRSRRRVGRPHEPLPV